MNARFPEALPHHRFDFGFRMPGKALERPFVLGRPVLLGEVLVEPADSGEGTVCVENGLALESNDSLADSLIRFLELLSENVRDGLSLSGSNSHSALTTSGAHCKPLGEQ